MVTSFVVWARLRAVSSRPRTPAVERFWLHVGSDGSGRCWAWFGAVNSTGYPVFKVAPGRVVLAQRLLWTLEYGEPIPKGHQVVRLCGNRACMNVEHFGLRKWMPDDRAYVTGGNGTIISLR